MKTKELIRILQEADPSGESHVRMDGGIPFGVNKLDGYWDGYYTYLDENDNFVSSIEGSKVDILCMDIDDYVSNMIERDDGITWEEVKSKFVFKFGDYSDENQRNEKADNILAKAKERYIEYNKVCERLFNAELKDALKHEKEGWSWFQNKKVNSVPENEVNMHYYYTWKIYKKNKKKESSNAWNTQPILKSGLFERLDNGKKRGYYQWVLKH